jgi:hypothetical protein
VNLWRTLLAPRRNWLVWTTAIAVGWGFVAAAQNPPKPDPDDPGPPVLKRGGNAPRKAPPPGPDIKSMKIPPRPVEDEETKGAPSAAPPAARASDTPAEAEAASNEPEKKVIRFRPSGDELIDRMREASLDFDEGLPNFICDQGTVRYESKTGSAPVWKKQDRIDVELLYIDRKEEYRNVRINGKVTKKDPEQTGQWSRGDFGTTLMDIMSPATNAKFKKRPEHEKIEGLDAVIYNYTVAEPNSHWRIQFDGELKPAYKGSLWVDPVSARVLRIEMQAMNIPASYAVDAVEVTLEYGWVTIGQQKYLLPTRSDNLSCQRGTPFCAKNEITFKNYRRFSAESTISTTDSSVSFDGEEKPGADGKAAPPAAGAAKPKKKK